MALSNAASQEDAVTRKSCCSSAQIQVEAQELKNDHFSDHLVFSGANPDLVQAFIIPSAKPFENIELADVSFKEKRFVSLRLEGMT